MKNGFCSGLSFRVMIRKGSGGELERRTGLNSNLPVSCCPLKEWKAKWPCCHQLLLSLQGGLLPGLG